MFNNYRRDENKKYFSGLDMKNEVLIKKTDGSIGGPNTFMRNLFIELDKKDFPYTDNCIFPKVFFFPISADIKEIKRIKAGGGKIIQRLDGVYYPSKHGACYEERNELIKTIYLNYADIVVFQSEYSRKQCFQMFGEKKEENYRIIINGSDTNVFFPNNRNDTAPQMKFITTGNFRNDDMLIPLINAMDIVLEQKDNIVLRIVGPVSINKKEEFLKRSYVEYYGEKSLHEIAELLRDSDVFIYSHLNPPCPNSVIEAVSCGLPVVGFKSGAMEEICYFNKELLAFVSDDVFQKYEDFNPEFLARKVILCLSEIKRFKENALKYHENFSMDQCARSYMDIFQEVLDKKRENIKLFKMLKNLIGMC